MYIFSGVALNSQRGGNNVVDFQWGGVSPYKLSLGLGQNPMGW